MINYKIPLPNHLYSKYGDRNNVSFELKRDSYSINGKVIKVPFNNHNNKDFQGYQYNILNTFILVTLFFEKDILST